MEREPAHTLMSPDLGYPDQAASHPSATLGQYPPTLRSMLEEVFDPEWDRIVHGTERGNGKTASPVAGGLAAALGFIGARHRLKEDRWVVYVAGRLLLSSVVSQLDHWSAFRLDRFLVIVSAGSTTPESLRNAERRGLPIVDLSPAADPLELRAELERVRNRNTACVALVNPDLFADDSPETSACEPRDWAEPRDPVLDALVTAARRDPRIAPVLMCRDPRWSPLAELLPASLLRVAPQDLDEAIPWCLALAEGGCHPVLIVNGRQVGHRRRLAEQLRHDPQLITLIVDDRQSCCEQIYELADGGTASTSATEFVPGMPWMCPESVEDATTTLRDALAERRPVAVQLRPSLAERRLWPRVAPSLSRRPGRPSRTGDGDQAAIAGKSLGPDVLTWVEEYERISHRSRYLWQWCLHGLELTTLSCVPPRCRRHVCDTKLLAVMYGVLLDDIADREHDDELLRWLARATLDGGARDFNQVPSDRRTYAEFTCRVWDCYCARIRQFPRYEEFAQILEYDSHRVVNTMRYAILVNSDVRVMNRAEHDLYTPHNMQMMTFAMVDLMASPGFDIAELGPVRQAIWHAQCMGRIGNLVSTWERELDEGDFSSGVFSRLVGTGDLRIADLPETDGDTIRRAVRSRGIECSFLDEWVRHRRELRAMVQQVGSVDLNRIVTALERLIHMELFSRGLK